MMIRRNGVVVVGALACGVGMAFAVGARAQEAEAASPPKVEEAVKAAPEEAPLIPREVFFGNPDKASVQLSPDGKQISYLAPVEGVLNVWVGPADKPADAKPVTDDTHRGIRSYFWAQTSQHVLYIQDKDGDENWHLYSVNLEDNKTHNAPSIAPGIPGDPHPGAEVVGVGGPAVAAIESRVRRVGPRLDLGLVAQAVAEGQVPPCSPGVLRVQAEVVLI